MSFKLSTGKEVDANCGIIGLGPAPEYTIGEGYDGHLEKYGDRKGWDDEAKPTDPYSYTREEQIEIADIMIARWQEFKLSVASALREGSGKS
jgi:hypothetical protein